MYAYVYSTIYTRMHIAHAMSIAQLSGTPDAQACKTETVQSSQYGIQLRTAL